MQIRKVQGLLNGVVILSEASHIFCCVLPTLFSVMSILVGLGVAGAMPLWLSGIHDMIHVWEVPIIMTSAAVLLIGWSVHYLSRKMDCHDTGCHHPPCEPQKKSAVVILKIATLLFIGNITVFLIFHKGLHTLGLMPENPPSAATDSHDRGD
ncbi:MAG: hypothetical protein H6858_00155 [Rhodospirillales bacterium]|nr:hypothetical protein [Alphaproteobacteria bacterium]MCB1840264.1 hypothetical protein [Alphaproteobacteria bacterium]MCB9975991.1 hypothetical protein [Rhodospirillales bacterium]